MLRSLHRILAISLVIGLAACAAPSAPTAIPSRPTVAAPGAAGPAERPDSIPGTGKVTAIQDMLADRAAHTATRLPDGRVLVAGGFNDRDRALSSAEVFDPALNRFSPIGAMSVARQSHTATLLSTGSVLIAGGYGPDGAYLDSAEVYDPVTGRFSPIGPMATPRAGHIAAPLNNGQILFAGGVTTGWVFLASAELFSPRTGAFTPTGAMAVARESHTATVLPDGTVLVVGGHQGRRAAIVIHSSAEVYDPATGLFTATGSLVTKRHKHDALLLGDGRVLVIGGADDRDNEGQYHSVEVYDPSTGQFTLGGAMHASRYKFQGTSVLLSTGGVLLLGGAGVTEIYDPITDTFTQLSAGLGATRLFAAAAPLPEDRVLLTGGYGPDVSASARAWVFQP